MSPATFSAKLALIQQVVFAERASIRSRCLPLWMDVLLWRAGALTLLLPAVVPIRSWRRYGHHRQELLLSIALLILACLEVLAILVLLLAVRAVLLLLLAIALLFVVLSVALALLLAIALLFVVLSVNLLLLVVHVELSILLLRRLTVAWMEVIAAVAAAAPRMVILILAVRHGSLGAELLVLVFDDD
jgi:hypothetical protein